MDWRLKALAFRARSKTLHRIAQKMLTGRYFQSVTPTLLAAYNFHVEHFRRLPAGSTALEIGAGRHLLCPLLLSRAGASRVYAIDIDRIATVEQVNGVLAQLPQAIGGYWPLIQSMEDLETLYRIDYRAPSDASATGLDHVDFICSTSTLEHIPRDDLLAVHAECVRLKPALVSHIIDYHDHFATFDRSIGMTNFYRFSDRAWKLWNPSMHYQNRLRHCDQLALFEKAGLHVVSDERRVRTLSHPPLAKEFRRYSAEDLSTMNGLTVLSS